MIPLKRVEPRINSSLMDEFVRGVLFKGGDLWALSVILKKK